MREGEADNIENLLLEIRTQIADLAARVSRLEKQRDGERMVAVEQALPRAKPVLSEERLIAISAAVAAFLGERVRILQVRLIRSSAWAQQGRVSLQASHWLHQ